MQELPPRFILSKKPKEYLKQGISHCGVYSVKAILSAFGLDNREHPKDYHTNWIGKNLFSMAVGEKYYDRIFRSYGVSTETKTAKSSSDKEKLVFLKTLLTEDNPVMIRIGNGYLTNRYNPILGKIVPHWITLWGYDDAKEFFYIYDSGLPKEFWDNTLPIGNTIRTYKEILRDWNYGRWQPWCWNTSSENYLYIKVRSKARG